MTSARSLTSLVASLGSLAVVIASIALLPGCGGRSLGDELNSRVDPNTPADAGPDGRIVCHDPTIECDPGDQSVASEAACGDAQYCYSRSGSCGGAPVWCAHLKTVQCGAIPRCDQGDTEVASCPPPPPGPDNGFSCYPRTLCGSTIQYVHRDTYKTLPACDPGDKKVTSIDTCTMPGVSCYSRTACNFTIHCYTP